MVVDAVRAERTSLRVNRTYLGLAIGLGVAVFAS